MFSRNISVYKKIIRFRNLCQLIEIQSPLTGFHQEQVNFFMKTLDFTKFKTFDVLTKYPNMKYYDAARLEKAYKMLNRMGFTDSEIKEDPNVLTLLPASVQQHTMVLQEVGFKKINTTCIRSYVSLGKKSITLLKAHQYLADDANVRNNLLSYLDDAFEMPESTIINDEVTLNFARLVILREYLRWYLDMNENELQHLFKTYDRIKNKSLRLIRQTLTKLIDLGYTKDKIKRNGYLIHSHPENIDRMLNEVKEIAGKDIREIVLKFPKILMVNPATILKTSTHLKEFGISDDAVRRCLAIFTLSSKSVYERLTDLTSIPEFRALYSHPRILRLVHYQKKAKSRLEYLQQMRIKCVSLHVLSSTRQEFEKYAREGSDRTKGKDMVAFLVSEFGKPVCEIREQLNRHTYWCHIPVHTAKSTLDMLRKMSYLNKHLFHNLHILLYPKHDVRAVLDELSSKRTHPGLPGIEDLTILEREKIISLAMYLLEKKHHFSGNGIWDETNQEIARPIDANSPLPQGTIGKNIQYRYLPDNK